MILFSKWREYYKNKDDDEEEDGAEEEDVSLSIIHTLL